MSLHPLGPPVVMPDPVIVLRAFLRSEAVVTDIVGDRISTALPQTPSWPRIRITTINVWETFARRLDRVLMQFDCYATADPDAARLAQSVRAALAAATSWVHPSAVITGTDGLGLMSIPDDEFTPPMPRWLVTGHIYIRSNP